ncbi:MAG: hypothetical protein LBK72_09145 [Bifidobacteriaceae bacterium]|nr:hypothetical protein [Bifidobacteriaceae bacterium]
MGRVIVGVLVRVIPVGVVPVGVVRMLVGVGRVIVGVLVGVVPVGVAVAVRGAVVVAVETPH